MLDPVSISILTGESNIFAGEMHIFISQFDLRSSYPSVFGFADSHLC